MHVGRHLEVHFSPSCESLRTLTGQWGEQPHDLSATDVWWSPWNIVGMGRSFHFTVSVWFTHKTLNTIVLLSRCRNPERGNKNADMPFWVALGRVDTDGTVLALNWSPLLILVSGWIWSALCCLSSSTAWFSNMAAVKSSATNHRELVLILPGWYCSISHVVLNVVLTETELWYKSEHTSDSLSSACGCIFFFFSSAAFLSFCHHWGRGRLVWINFIGKDVCRCPSGGVCTCSHNSGDEEILQTPLQVLQKNKTNDSIYIFFTLSILRHIC